MSCSDEAEGRRGSLARGAGAELHAAPATRRIEHPQELINRLQYGAADAEQVGRPSRRPAGRCARCACRACAAAALQQGRIKACTVAPSVAPCSLLGLPNASMHRSWLPCPSRLLQVQRGKGPYPVAEYRLAAEISAAQAAQAAAAAAGAAGDGSAFADDWYQPLLAGDATGPALAGDGWAGAGQTGDARGVYSFCMCPGGQIVPTSTDEGELCINGMSFSRRGLRPARLPLGQLRYHRQGGPGRGAVERVCCGRFPCGRRAPAPCNLVLPCLPPLQA